MMSTFFVPIGKEIGDCWATEHLQAFWKRAFRKALPLRSGRPERSNLCFPRKGAGNGPPPTEFESLLASGCYASSGLSQGRVGNLKVLDLRSTVDHFRQRLQHFWIAAAEIGFRILFLVPKTDSHPFRS